MKRRHFLLWGLFLFISIMIVVGFFLWKNHRSDIEYSKAITEIEASISSGYYEKAKTLILSLVNNQSGRNEGLSILRLSFRLSDLDGDSFFFMNTAKRVWEKLPSSINTIVYAYSIIRNGKHKEKAYNLLKKLKVRDKTLLHLRNTMLLELALSDGFAPVKSNDDESKLILDAVKAGKNAEPDDLVKLADRYGSYLAVDAVLLLAERGKLQEAYGLLKSVGNIKNFRETELKFNLAYDTGDWNESMVLLDDQIEREGDQLDLLIVKGDIYNFMGKREEAKKIYEKAIEKNPSYSWLPYYNLSRIFEIEGDVKKRDKTIAKALRYFPSNRTLGIYAVKKYISENRMREARELVYRLAEIYPDDDTLKLFETELYGNVASSGGYLSDLWMMFNRHPSEEIFARYLFSQLFGLNNFKDAKLVLDIYSESLHNNEIPWVIHYRGLLAAMNGKYESALGLLEKSISMKEDWAAVYNLSIIQTALGDYSAARANLNKCLSITGLSDMKTLSLIHYQVGKNYLLEGNKSLARRELEYALHIDSSNTAAALLLKKSELEDTSD